MADKPCLHVEASVGLPFESRRDIEVESQDHEHQGNSRRRFLTLGVAAAALCRSGNSLAPAVAPQSLARLSSQSGSSPPDYTLHFESSAIEIAPERIISAISYNGQFPGPLLHFKERQSVTMEVQNDTDTPEQLHWHGQFVSPDVDGAAEEGTPFIPARGMRRIVFTPRPAGFRFYHTHNRAGADLCYRTQIEPSFLAAGSRGTFIPPPAQSPRRIDVTSAQLQ